MSADPLPDPNANDGHAKCRDETRLARDLAGHRIREIHDCFLMNCRDLGDEVRSLYERLALPLASETTEDITTPEGYRARYDDITQRPLASETTDADPETYRRGWIAGHKQGCLDTLAPPLASETTDAGLLRAIESLHRERWPNESSDYDPAKDNECRPIIEQAVRAALSSSGSIDAERCGNCGHRKLHHDGWEDGCTKYTDDRICGCAEYARLSESVE